MCKCARRSARLSHFLRLIGRALSLSSLSFIFLALEILPCTISRRVHTQRHLSAAAIIDKHRRRATREKEQKKKAKCAGRSLFRTFHIIARYRPPADPRSRYVLYRSAPSAPSNLGRCRVDGESQGDRRRRGITYAPLLRS